ncbi:hypothetical protein CDD80_2226 [Ophiocordyceps camponoti-rufipedis]|uniref:Mediator of RNA polymerase II transcription subunit 12 n=1 Tax=Ophiocordyceps camponoti-rufipedis TaxID=2004952 RepID=A0A2C5Z7B4_9HYPO|nr:hypothetical protein CDD80_2226 [Ophiocordyceps camponoti-rufipedis]
MTSRPPMGVPPRQPPRAPAPNLAVQHHQRSLSQQYLAPSSSPSSSPSVRRDPHVDAPGEPPESLSSGSQARPHASTPRRGSSKLRLELSTNDWDSALANTTDSPQILTPSRVAPVSVPVPDATSAVDKVSPAQSGSQLDDNPPIPMPKRRPQPIEKPISAPRPSTTAVAPTKKDARPKPYTVEVPSDAPRFVSIHKHDIPNRDPFSKGLHNGHADFFPWSGQHHEDEWSSEAIQKGTWDRGAQNETSSARMAVLPALKQKSGLNALSTIFMGVMNQRRFRGQILSPSTFKPPPRVTLTDTKREVWLKDLANPTISLRRLSRTIPHGIRGRTLLDQCLNKNVPTERAVWLAKCVGANEIRAFKRKGAGGAFVMGGESKWVRDWTVFVEQFVEAVVSAFGEPDWKTRVTYAIRLATNLYSEHLLDRDHYLDWITSNLENSSQAKMPMWILIAQITWADLVRSRKYGRRLVYTLLAQLNIIHNDPDRDILIQLSSQLTGLLKTLLRNNPESFVAPGLWPRHRDALKAFLAQDDGVSQDAWQRVNGRNARLLVASTASPPAGRQHLIKLFDSTIQGHYDRELAAKCLAVTDDRAELVKTLVEWATSVHRPGLAKIYVAVSLIKSWAATNATSVIVDLLDDVPPTDRLRKKAIFHLVSELVRGGLFSVPKYIKWLIGRGGLHDAAEIDPDDGPCSSRLLVELPIHCLSESQRSQRTNLLRRAGQYSTADEAKDMANALRCVDGSLGLSQHLGDADGASNKCLSLPKLLRRVSHSSKAVQSSIGAHLRDVLTPELLAKVEPVAALSMFSSARLVLETAQDFGCLSQVLKSHAAASDVDVLAACADTINSLLDVFLAMGTADGLFGSLSGRLKSLNREQAAGARPLLVALTSLARRLPHRSGIAQQLQRELAQSERSSAIDACSPVSDSMALNGESEVSEQIDKLLASGNTVDPPTMNRLFRNIIPKLEAGWVKADGGRRLLASLLARLRIFDAQHFDKLMADWVSHVGTLGERPRLATLFPMLISLGCLSMPMVLQSANSVADPGSASDASAVYLQELLQLVVMKPPRAAACLDTVEAYRFEVQQKAARLEHPGALLSLIRKAVSEYAAVGTRHRPLDEAGCEDGLVETMRYLVVADSSAVAKALDVGTLATGAVELVKRIVGKLLAPDGQGGCQESLDRLLSLSNELTMPFCQLKLDVDLSGEGDDKALEGFARAMDRAIEARSIAWTRMLPCLSQDITRSLSTQAHARFLGLMPSPKSAKEEEEKEEKDDDDDDGHVVDLAENLLGVLEAITPPKSAQLTTALAEKLCDLWEIVASPQQHQKKREVVLDRWLPALLRFVVLHSACAPEATGTGATGATTTTNTNSSTANTAPTSATTTAATAPTTATTTATSPQHDDVRARIILILCGLLLELDRPSLSEHVLDVATLLIDTLPDETRIQCSKTVLFLPGSASQPHASSSSSDARLYYLFSLQPPTWAENLKLAHKERASIAYSAAARGMSTLYGIGPASSERLSPYVLRRWEVLSEPTPNVGENDTSLSLGLFEAIKMQ